MQSSTIENAENQQTTQLHDVMFLKEQSDKAKTEFNNCTNYDVKEYIMKFVNEKPEVMHLIPEGKCIGVVEAYNYFKKYELLYKIMFYVSQIMSDEYYPEYNYNHVVIQGHPRDRMMMWGELHGYTYDEKIIQTLDGGGVLSLNQLTHLYSYYQKDRYYINMDFEKVVKKCKFQNIDDLLTYLEDNNHRIKTVYKCKEMYGLTKKNLKYDIKDVDDAIFHFMFLNKYKEASTIKNLMNMAETEFKMKIAFYDVPYSKENKKLAKSECDMKWNDEYKKWYEVVKLDDNFKGVEYFRRIENVEEIEPYKPKVKKQVKDQKKKVIIDNDDEKINLKNEDVQEVEEVQQTIIPENEKQNTTEQDEMTALRNKLKDYEKLIGELQTEIVELKTTNEKLMKQGKNEETAKPKKIKVVEPKKEEPKDIFYVVPYHKDQIYNAEAKALGCKFNGKFKKWFILDTEANKSNIEQLDKKFNRFVVESGI